MAHFIVNVAILIFLHIHVSHTMDTSQVTTISIVSPCQFDMGNTPCILENASTRWVSTGDNSSVSWVLALPEEMAFKLYGALENIALINSVPILNGRNVSSKHSNWERWHPEYNFSPQDGYHRLNITLLVKEELEVDSRFHVEFRVGNVTYKTGEVHLFHMTSEETSSASLPDNQTASSTLPPNNSVPESATSPTYSSNTSHLSSLWASLTEINTPVQTIYMLVYIFAIIVDKWATIKTILLIIYSQLVNWILTPMQQCFGRLRQSWSPSSSSPTQRQSSSPLPNLPSQPHILRDGLEQEHEASTTNPHSMSVHSDTNDGSTSKEAAVQTGEGTFLHSFSFPCNFPTASDTNDGSTSKEAVVQTGKGTLSISISFPYNFPTASGQGQIRVEIYQPPNAEHNNQEQANVVTTTEDTKSPSVEDVTFQAPGADDGGEMDQHVDDKKVQVLVPPEELDDQEKILAERECLLPHERFPLLENKDGHAKSPVQ